MEDLVGVEHDCRNREEEKLALDLAGVPGFVHNKKKWTRVPLTHGGAELWQRAGTLLDLYSSGELWPMSGLRPASSLCFLPGPGPLVGPAGYGAGAGWVRLRPGANRGVSVSSVTRSARLA